MPPESSTPEGRRSSGRKRAAPIANVPSLFWRTFNYRCPFCLKLMQPLPVRFPAALWIVLGFRLSNCPHCFDVRWTPCHFMKYIIAPFRFIYLAFTEEVD